MTSIPEEQQSVEIIEVVTLDELCRVCKVQTEWVIELVTEGILEPEGDEQTSWRFTPRSISRTRIAWRLKEDLGVNKAGIAIALDLLEERENLKHQLLQTE